VEAETEEAVEAAAPIEAEAEEEEVEAVEGEDQEEEAEDGEDGEEEQEDAEEEGQVEDNEEKEEEAKKDEEEPPEVAKKRARSTSTNEKGGKKSKKEVQAAEEEEEKASAADASAAATSKSTKAVDTEKTLVEDAGPKARLMIKQIVLTNFKSYGGRKVIGPFNKSFSSIVGPNGSGKSNTIDALLFVFGKRAKKMRLNKVSELIHASHSMQNLGSAKVDVTFQDIIDTGERPEDYEVVEGTEVTVSREAFRNNQSKYYLDGRASNFTEVTTLLRKRGVDLEHNRFLILQGEVEQISLMKPKAQGPHEEGLLEYLEDIIGCNRLVEPIEQAEAAVETLTEQRQEKLNRLRVAERERESLDGPRKEAEAWVGAEGERLELQALVAQAGARRSHAGTKELEEQHKVLQGHMEEHRKKMEGFEKQVKKIETEHNTHLKEYEKLKSSIEKKGDEFKEFERQDVKFSEDIAFNEQKLQKLQQTAKMEKDSIETLLADAEQLRKDAPLREKELESAERHRASVAAKLEKVYESLKGKAEKLRPQKEAKEKELIPLQKKLTEVRKVVEVAQTEAQILREKTSKAAEEIESVREEHHECQKRLKLREEQCEEAAAQTKDRSKLITDAKSRLAALEEQAQGLAQEVAATRVKAEEAKSSFEQEHHRGRLIRAVYEKSKAGALRGVHGRLGDLGAIGKKYDTAVSTACGMLDAIVVDSTEDAQAVVELCRREELGRCTCICLQKIKEQEKYMDQNKTTPEGAERLLDLIKPAKPEYRVAFYFALRDTLVTKDLDQATRIGLQGKSRCRVVTLDGKLIDSSGTMSGGGNHVAKGGMRASLCMHSPEEIKAMVHAYETANAKLTALRQEKRQLEEALVLTEKEMADLKLSEQKSSMEVTSLKKQLDGYDSRLKTLKVPTLSSGEKSKLKELEKLISSRANELNDIQQKHQSVEEQVRELHNQIMNIGGEELKTAKAKDEEAAKKCEDLRKNIKKALLDADNMVKNSEKAKGASKAAEKEAANTEKALIALREEHAKLDDKAERVLNEYNALKEQLVEKDKVLVTLQGKRDDVLQSAKALKSQEVDLVQEMEEKTRTLRDLYARITQWGNKLQEARKEYEQLPLDILGDIRSRAEEQADPSQVLARKAIKSDLKDEQLDEVETSDAEARMLILEANLKNLKPNLSSIEEFRRADTEHRTRLQEYDQINGDREDARRKLESLRQQRLEEFMEGFSVISMKLKEMYQMITLGGDAELELVDTLDPFSEGINFSVRPPKKSWKQITNLSGGEKTLASLSLVFALHHYRPTPLYFMDEIDAALDFRNVSIIANYIKERTKNAQFIVISLRNHMFEMADLLVGIYKTQDVSKSVAVTPTAFEVRTGASAAPLQDAAPTARGNKRAAAGPPIQDERATQLRRLGA
jgi:structural maintenance of chromosome 4